MHVIIIKWNFTTHWGQNILELHAYAFCWRTIGSVCLFSTLESIGKYKPLHKNEFMYAAPSNWVFHKYSYLSINYIINDEDIWIKHIHHPFKWISGITLAERANHAYLISSIVNCCMERSPTANLLKILYAFFDFLGDNFCEMVLVSFNKTIIIIVGHDLAIILQLHQKSVNMYM